MIGRFILVLTFVALLVSLLLSFGSPRPLAAQDLLPTPVGHLGGPVPLPTAPGLIGDSPLQNTPVPAGHLLVGTWLLAFEGDLAPAEVVFRSEEHTSELQSLTNLVCRLLLEKKKKKQKYLLPHKKKKKKKQKKKK